MHLPLLFVLVTLLLFSAACSKHFSLAAPSAPKVMKTGYSVNDYKADVSIYEKSLSGEDPTGTGKAKQIRNKIVYSLMAEIDRTYGDYTVGLYTGKGFVGVGGDSMVLGLTAASTIATHTPTKTILSALGTALTGVNLSFDKNFFAQQTYQAIAIAMQTRRDKARLSMVASLDKSAIEYPLEAARRDLNAYFNAGTLPGGLQELQEEAGAAAKTQSEAKTQSIH
jgi:hypothetical protein